MVLDISCVARESGDLRRDMSEGREHEALHVVVHFAAAEKPYREDAPRTQTVGELKTLVLKAFGLSEGTGQGGTNVTYTLFYEKRALDNLTETLGQIAGDKESLELKLVQQITQGSASCRRPSPL